MINHWHRTDNHRLTSSIIPRAKSIHTHSPKVTSNLHMKRPRRRTKYQVVDQGIVFLRPHRVSCQYNNHLDLLHWLPMSLSHQDLPLPLPTHLHQWDTILNFILTPRRYILRQCLIPQSQRAMAHIFTTQPPCLSTPSNRFRLRNHIIIQHIPYPNQHRLPLSILPRLPYNQTHRNRLIRHLRSSIRP